MIKIYYTEYFDEFVKKFPKARQDLIKKIIEDYCDHNVLLPRPKPSAIMDEIQKVGILQANIVIFYLELDDTWVILTGVEMFERVA